MCMSVFVCMGVCLPPRVHSSGYDKAEESHSLGCSDDSTLLQLGGRPQSAVAGYLPMTQIHTYIPQITQAIWKTLMFLAKTLQKEQWIVN